MMRLLLRLALASIAATTLVACETVEQKETNWEPVPATEEIYHTVAPELLLEMTSAQRKEKPGRYISVESQWANEDDGLTAKVEYTYLPGNYVFTLRNFDDHSTINNWFDGKKFVTTDSFHAIDESSLYSPRYLRFRTDGAGCVYFLGFYKVGLLTDAFTTLTSEAYAYQSSIVGDGGISAYLCKAGTDSIDDALVKSFTNDFRLKVIR